MPFHKGSLAFSFFYFCKSVNLIGFGHLFGCCSTSRWQVLHNGTIYSRILLFSYDGWCNSTFHFTPHKAQLSNIMLCLVTYLRAFEWNHSQANQFSFTFCLLYSETLATRSFWFALYLWRHFSFSSSLCFSIYIFCHWALFYLFASL